ncbi:MAG TPA: preprotein translocase subunit SecG [Bacillota bacterium]|nr:preprotein translocase subunit SecG [Bacillota bacterium]
MLKTILTVFHVILSIVLIAAVVLQSGRSAGLSGSIAGGAETLFGGKKKGLDELLARITVIVAVLFGASALAIMMIDR